MRIPRSLVYPQRGIREGGDRSQCHGRTDADLCHVQRSLSCRSTRSDDPVRSRFHQGRCEEKSPGPDNRRHITGIVAHHPGGLPCRSRMDCHSDMRCTHHMGCCDRADPPPRHQGRCPGGDSDHRCPVSRRMVRSGRGRSDHGDRRIPRGLLGRKGQQRHRSPSGHVPQDRKGGRWRL